MKHAPGFLTLVEKKRAYVREISIDELLSRLPPADFHLIDVREDPEWHKGHLPSARHLGKGIIERDIEGLIPEKDAELVLYCGGGYRSVLAAHALGEMGYRNVCSLAGGYRAWIDRKLPIEAP